MTWCVPRMLSGCKQSQSFPSLWKELWQPKTVQNLKLLQLVSLSNNFLVVPYSVFSFSMAYVSWTFVIFWWTGEAIYQYYLTIEELLFGILCCLSSTFVFWILLQQSLLYKQGWQVSLCLIMVHVNLTMFLQPFQHLRRFVSLTACTADIVLFTNFPRTD